MEWIIPLMVAVPIGTAILIIIISKFTDAFSNVLSLLGTGFLIYGSFTFLGTSPMVYKMGGWYPPIGISMYIDSLSALMLILTNIIAFLIVIFSISYIKATGPKSKFWALLLLMIGGMNGVLITGDLFNLFVFLEIASISSYALVAYGSKPQQLEAAFKYLIIGSMASTFILLGIALLYLYTGTVNMADIARYLDLFGGGRIAMFSTALFIMGFATKAAFVPFHAWLPDAHPSAPAPISAMLSGVLVKTLGLYAIVRIVFNVIGFSSTIGNILLGLGGLSMVVGSMLSVGQDDLKRLLAYCTIAQVGYIAVGIGLGTPLGLAGALFHMANHGVNKSLLFLNSGSIERSTGTRDITQMGGIMKSMPITGTTTVIGSLGMCGVPPFNAFWSKVMIFIATLESQHYLLTFLLAFETLVTILAFARLLSNVVFATPKEGTISERLPAIAGLSPIILSAIALVVGIGYSGVLNMLIYPARTALLEKAVYIKNILGG